jgi:hypothetical protein
MPGTENRRTARRRAVLGACAAWMSVHVLLRLGATLLPALVPVTEGFTWTLFAPAAVAVLVLSTPLIYRLGCWLNRKFDADVNGGAE